MDKIGKINKELERLREETSIGLSVHENGVEQGRMEIINALSVFLDSLQKEPVSEIDFEQELHKYFGQVKDFTLCVNIAKHFYDEGYFDGHIHDGDRIEDVDGRKVNVSRFRRVAKPLEAPVSEDLEKAAVEAFKQIVDENRNSFLEIFKAGAKWKAEQLMAKAFDFTKEHNTACILASECLRGNGWFSKERDFNELFRHLSCVDELFEGKFSGKTKVIVIKED